MACSNHTLQLVMDYMHRRTMSKLGFKASLDTLTDFEVAYLTYCHSEFEQLSTGKSEEKDLTPSQKNVRQKKAARKRGR